MIKEDISSSMCIAFAKNLRALRTLHGHSQGELSAKLNLSKSCISNYENAMRLPDANTLDRISKLYGVSMEYLVGSSKRPRHHTAEDKYIDKQRYLDLNNLSCEHQRTIREIYELFYVKDNRYK